MKYISVITSIFIFSSCNLLSPTGPSAENNASNNGTNSSNNATTNSGTNNKTTSTNNESTPTNGTSLTATGTSSGTTSGTTGTFKIPFSRMLTSKRTSEGLVAQWDFDDLNDKVGDANLVNLPGRVTIANNRLHLAGGSAGRADTSQLSTSLKSTNAFTIELWLEPSSVLQDEAVVLSLNGSPGVNFSLTQDADNAIVRLRTDDASLHYDRRSGDEPLVIEDSFRTRPTHFVWIYDGTHTEFWIDGVSRGTMPIPGGLSVWENGYGLFFGGEETSNNWEGTISYASIYNRALRDEEIKHHHALGDGIEPEIPINTDDVRVQSCEVWPFDIFTLEDFRAFAAAECTSVDGNVRVPLALNNLDQLALLKHISGDLIIEETSVLSVDGLSALENIGGKLIISNNMNLDDLSALNSLTMLGDDLVVTFNPLLENFDLIGINTLPGHLILKNNTSLSSANGLAHLESVGGSLVLDQLENLESISLLNLESVGTIFFSRVPVVAIEMPKLQNAETIRLMRLSNFVTFSSPVTPKLFDIIRNYSLTNLDEFHGSIQTTFNVGYNNSLTRLDIQATELAQIIIVGNSNLSSLDLLTLGTVTNDFDLTSSGIVSLDGALPKLTSAGEIILWENDLLSSMVGAFPQLQTPQSLIIRYSPLLTKVSNAFPALESTNYVRISNNETLPQCDVDILVEQLMNNPQIYTIENNGPNNCAR